VLRSDDDDVVRAGAWIASELGVAAAPVIDDLTPLLGHPLKSVRNLAVDAVLAAASAADGEVIARTLGLIEDAEDAVCWKVLHLLARASSEQLRAALPEAPPPNGRVSARARPFLVPSRSRFRATVYPGEVASGRTQALQRATASSDDEVRTFAREELDAAIK
jgi:hypothetical protein